MTQVAEEYVDALAAKDTERLLALFAPDALFRGLTPGRPWEAHSPSEIVHDVLYRWFDADDHIESVEHVDVGTVVDRHRVDYRLKVRNADGLHLVEQRAYFDVTEGRISRMHVMCAGFRPI